MTIDYELGSAREQIPFECAPFQEWFIGPKTLWASFYRIGAECWLRFPGLADFVVSADGRHVAAHPVPGASTSTVEHLYLNQALPLALSRQGKLVMHASCVCIDQRAVAFMGRSGRGKSTLATAFSASGAQFLTDDGLRLIWQDKHVWVEPSHPSIRLWTDSHEALLAAGTVAQAPALEYTSKARLLAGPGLPFCDQAQPLHGIFLLGDGAVDQVVISSIKPAEALIELAKHSFVLDLEQQAVLAWHFDELHRLATVTPVMRLDYPRRYAALPAVCDAVRRHVADTLP